MFILKNDKIDKIVDKALLVSFCIYCICLTFTYSILMVDYSTFGYIIAKIIKITFFIPPLKIFYDFLLKRFNIKEIIIYGILGIIFFSSYAISKDGMMLLILLYTIAFRKYDYNKIIKYSFFSILSTVILIFISSFFVNTNIHNVTQVRHNEDRIRYALGFWYSAYIANHFLTLSLLYTLFKKKFNIYDYIVILLINIVLYIFTDTKFVFALIILLLITKLYFDKFYNDKIYKIFSYITISSFALGFLLIIVLTVLYSYNIEIVNKLNALFSGRLGLCLNGFRTWGIHLLGCYTNMRTDSEVYNYVDPDYFRVLYTSGPIILIIAIVYFTNFTHFAYKSKYTNLLIVLFIASLRSIFDPQLFILHLSPFVLLYFPLHQLNNVE